MYYIQTGSESEMASTNGHGAAHTPRGISEADLDRLIAYINEIRFGSVTVVIQDGRVLQIEKNEKIRLK
jgi:hypothetical protein